MSAGVLTLWLLTAAAGAACAGLVRVDLRLEERVAVAAVAGIVGSALATLVVGLVLGLSGASALLGPVLLGTAAVIAGRLVQGVSPLPAWRAGWDGLVARRWERETWVVGAVAVLAAVAFWRLFAHTLFTGPDGSIMAGFATVWADWSLHSTLASSFAVAGNLPPHDPIFSGGMLRYPFLADFHSATFEAAGGSLEVALAAPCAVLCTAVTLLVVSIGRRLAGTVAVGILAMVLCLVGGGLGFRTIWWDACQASGRAEAQCAPGTAVHDAALSWSVLQSVHAVVTAQPRNYDNLQNSDRNQIGDSTTAGNQTAIQWYTPLLAWWLPQRTFVYGFAVGTAVLLLVLAGLRAPPPARSPFVAAGLLAGTLPLVHIHTLIALGIVLVIMALGSRRREWLWLGGVAALLAVPRLIQVAAAGSGTPNPSCPAASTHFPFLEVGWKSLSRDPADTCSVPGYSDLSPGGIVTGLGNLIRLPFRADFWAFWLDNQGVVIPVALVVTVAAGLVLLPRLTEGDDPRQGLARVTGALGGAGRRVIGALPADLVRFCLPFVAIFVISNIVVFQTWDWDNTKLLAWWYLGGALLTAAWIVAWWRRGRWRAAVASLALVTLLLSGGLSVTRVLQLEAGGPGAGGPFTWASPGDIALAAAVEASTPRGSTFLLPEVAAYGNTAPNQPVATLAGRSSLLGYGGWLYSYGVDQGTRPADRHTIYAGCAEMPEGGCPVPGLLRQYRIDFVLVPRDAPALAWFTSTYPVVVHSGAGDVVDVRER